MPEYSTLTVSQAAREIGVPATTLRRWTNQGHVPFMRTPGGQRRFTHQQIREIRKQVLTTPDAARELGMSATTLRRWANRGLIPFTTSEDGQRRFTWEHIREIRAQMHHPAESAPQQHAA